MLLVLLGQRQHVGLAVDGADDELLVRDRVALRQAVGLDQRVPERHGVERQILLRALSGLPGLDGLRRHGELLEVLHLTVKRFVFNEYKNRG